MSATSLKSNLTPTLVSENVQTLETDIDSDGQTVYRQIDYVPKVAQAHILSLTNSNLENSPVYRFFNQQDGTQFLTAVQSEADSLQKTDNFKIESSTFTSVGSVDPTASPVYRFFDTSNGTHFYTASINERDNTLVTRSNLTYEGADIYEHLSQQAGDVAVYRFFNNQTGAHLYTASADEIININAQLHNFHNEGIAFWAPKENL